MGNCEVENRCMVCGCVCACVLSLSSCVGFVFDLAGRGGDDAGAAVVVRWNWCRLRSAPDIIAGRTFGPCTRDDRKRWLEIHKNDKNLIHHYT